MPKASITRLRDGRWRLLYYVPSPIGKGMMAVCKFYLFPDGAFFDWARIEAKILREQKAYNLVSQLLRQNRFLSNEEDDLVLKLYKHQCKNITKRQYGYLKGIYERKVLGR
jgi:hypothetical protein